MTPLSIIVIGIQSVTWVFVIVLLFYRGIHHLTTDYSELQESIARNHSLYHNYTYVYTNSDVVRGHVSGVIMIIIGSAMAFVGPTLIVIKVIEVHRKKYVFQQIPQRDLPPKYEDVIKQDRAPSYSTLFPDTTSSPTNSLLPECTPKIGIVSYQNN